MSKKHSRHRIELTAEIGKLAKNHMDSGFITKPTGDGKGDVTDLRALFDIFEFRHRHFQVARGSTHFFAKEEPDLSFSTVYRHYSRSTSTQVLSNTHLQLALGSIHTIMDLPDQAQRFGDFAKKAVMSRGNLYALSSAMASGFRPDLTGWAEIANAATAGHTAFCGVLGEHGASRTSSSIGKRKRPPSESEGY